MTSQSSLDDLREREFADYNFQRARDAAFDAVQALWRRRKAEGWQQKDIAKAIGRDPAWVSRNLRGPGNWTMRIFGELVGGLRGEIEINVIALEEPLATRTNFHAYSGYSTSPPAKFDSVSSKSDVTSANIETKTLTSERANLRIEVK